MSPLFAKLNYKIQPEIVVINAPDALLPVMQEMAEHAQLVTDVAQIQDGGFMLAFVKTQQQVDTLTATLTEKLQPNGILWFAYPKGTSKNHQCEFNRDTGWTELGKRGFEPVRQVAIDADWTALRFRRVEHIKKLTRKQRITADS